MARPRIVEVDYHQFRTQLQAAADTGGRIEKTEKVKWKAWVREHKILEASFMSYASEYGDGAKPVIIEDGAFLGSRSIVVEGSRIGEEAVLGANVVITSSTKIIDVTGPDPVEMQGYVPPRSVVIPGTRTKKFPAGEYQIPVALIIGKRKASTDKKVTLNDALRDFGVSV